MRAPSLSGYPSGQPAILSLVALDSKSHHSHKLDGRVARRTLDAHFVPCCKKLLDRGATETTNMILAVCSKLLAFSTRAAHLVLGKEDLKEVISILTSEMEECFGDLREMDLGAIVERYKKQGRYCKSWSRRGTWNLTPCQNAEW
jgi:hypothetical protein